ncbi:MAG: Flp pilus assembly protein CpaB [Pseudomonadota bacterium]
MSPMRIIILLVAAVAAAAAALLVRNMANQPAPPPPAPVAPVQVTEVVEVPQTPVLVITRDVRVGTLLGPTDFAWMEWPDETLNVNYYTQDLQPNAAQDLAGSVVRTAMVMNEPVRPQKIVKKGETGYMAALLAEGMRAVAVGISTNSASGGFILPGDRVDILMSHTILVNQGNGDENLPTTTVLMENVRILAIDQIFSEGAAGQFAIGSTATVELNPDDARLLITSSSLGTLSMVLRSARDAVPGGPLMSRQDFLVDIAPMDDSNPEEGPPTLGVPTVRVTRAGATSVETPAGG